MINKLKPKSEFSRNVLTLMTGTTIAQAIPIAISPILTRIYTPEDFGIVAIFIAITYIFGSIANMNYELAIVIPKKDEDAINILALGLIIVVVFSFILLILVSLYSDYLAALLGNKEMEFWLYFIPISVFFSGLFNVLKFFNTRKKNYKDISNVTIVKSIILAIIQLSVGFLKQGATGLVAGNLVSNMFANLKLLKNIIKDRVLVSKISKVKMIALAKKYKYFPKYSVPSTILNVFSYQIPIILLGIFFNTSIVGFYSLSDKLVRMPIGVVGNSVGSVFYQQSSVIRNKKFDLSELTLRTYKKLFKIGLMPFMIMIVFGDYIFSFVFGEKWITAGEYVQLLSLWMFIVYIASPLSNLCFVLNKQKKALYFNFFMFVTNTVTISFSAFFLQNNYLTILFFSLVGLVFWLFWLVYLLKLVYIEVFPILFQTLLYILLSISGLYLFRIFLC